MNPIVVAVPLALLLWLAGLGWLASPWLSLVGGVLFTLALLVLLSDD